MKKLLALLLLIAFAVSISGCGSSTTGLEDDQKQAVELVWYSIGPTPKDFAKVMAKVNEYTKEKLNCTVKLEMIDFGDYEKKMQTIVAAGDADIMFTCSWAFDYRQNAMKGNFFPLTDLLPKYGQDMIKLMNPLLFEGTKIKGVNYTIPAAMDAYQQGYVFNKKLVDKYGFDFAAVKSETDLIPLFNKVRADHPELKSLRHPGWIEGRDKFDFVTKSEFPGAVRFGDDSCKVINQFEDAEFIAYMKAARKMYEGGYTYQEYLKEASDSEFRSGKVVCEVYSIKPLSSVQIERLTNFPVIIQPAFAKPIISTDVISGSQMAIAANSKNPARAMKFLNLFNSDPYLHNLICFGIEGEYYTKVNDKQIHITQAGKDNYDMQTQLFTLGNQSINYLLDDEPINSPEILKTFIDSAVISPLFGFVFDPSQVMDEIAAINNLKEQYVQGMKYGAVDIDSTLKEYNAKCKAVGVDKLLAEMQKQVDAWKMTKKQ
ncbi:MAG: ABC transporter substrate-binding protein [Negativicutes bacterium]|jgi:putative aldouronate transport system substrate-binding protein